MRNRENIKIKFKKDNTLTVIITSVLLITFAIIVVKLGFMTAYATKGDEISTLTAERETLVQQNKALETDIAQNQSLTRIENDAKTRLGMVKAANATYIDLSK